MENYKKDWQIDIVNVSIAYLCYGQVGCGTSNLGIQNQLDFVIENISWGLQKLGLILESEVVQKSSLEKNDFNKKWSPKLVFLDENFF